MEDEKQTSIIYKQHQETKKLLDDLKDKRNKLSQEEEKLKQEQERLNKELARINGEIESKKEKIDSILNDDTDDKSDFSGHLRGDEISRKCESLVDSFLSNVHLTLHFKIEYGIHQLEGQLDPGEDYTFHRLKLKMKRQFDKRENEFFFADERGMIFLDTLSVRRTLFPLQRVNIKGYIPKIRVLDKKSKLDVLSNDFNLFKKRVEEEQSQLEQNKSMKDILLEKLKKNAFHFVHLISFVIFVLFWCKAIIYFRYIEDNAAIVKSFFLDSDIYRVNVKSTLMAESIKGGLAKVFQFPSEEELANGFLYNTKNTKLFVQMNKNLGFVRLVQKRKLKIDCDNERLVESDINTSGTCYGYGESKETAYINGGTTYNYFTDESPKYIVGSTGRYDNSGFYIDVNVDDPVAFYKQMNDIITNKWIDSETKSVMLYANFYSTTVDLFIVFRVLFENVGSYYMPFVDFGLTDLTPIADNDLIVALVFSFVLLVNSILQLKTDAKKDKYKPRKRTWLTKYFCCFCTFGRWLYFHYRLPNLFELFSIMNIFFTYGCMIYKLQYIKTAGQATISRESFNDIGKYNSLYEMYFYISSANLLFYMFGLIDQISHFSDELKVIANSILSYIVDVSKFTILFFAFFVGLSSFIAYQMFGDFPLFYYRDSKFIILKIFGMLFRGSFENVDFDGSIDRNRMDSDDSNHVFNWVTRNAMNSSSTLFYHSGLTGFFLFGIIFYFIANFIIRVGQTAYFIVAYRYKYEDELKAQKEIKRAQNKK